MEIEVLEHHIYLIDNLIGYTFNYKEIYILNTGFFNKDYSPLAYLFINQVEPKEANIFPLIN